MLSFWGAVVVQSTATGFAMEFVGDAHEPLGAFVGSDSPTMDFTASSSDGPEGTSSVNITVALSRALTNTASASLSVGGGTATGGGQDYFFNGGTIQFNPGEITKTFNLLIVDDTINESDESITITLSNIVNATGGVTSYTYTIRDDEPLPTLAFDSASGDASEATTVVEIPVSLSSASGQTVSVNYAVTGGTATPNTDFTGGNGTLTFQPGETTRDIVLSVIQDGVSENDETIEITLSGPSNANLGGQTQFTHSVITVDLSGTVHDTQAAVMGGGAIPVVNATVSLMGTGMSTVTDSDGNFVLKDIPMGMQVLDFDTSTANVAPDGSDYAAFREGIMIEDKKNNISRPFFLPRIDSTSLTTVDPMNTTMVNNPGLKVTVEIPAGVAENENGSSFTGQMSISEVPEGLAPVALPEELDPGLLITVQPVGLIFNTPVAVTFPNVDNLPAGSEVDLWSVNPNTGQFEIVGVGKVSMDGTVIETISGGLSMASWHTMVPPDLETDQQENNEENEDKQKEEKECTGSQTALCSGQLTVIHPMVSYLSFEQIQELPLVYNSQTADPRPIIVSRVTKGVRNANPVTVSTLLEVDDVQQGNEIFTDGSTFMDSTLEQFRQAMQFDATGMETGVHNYKLIVKNNFSSSSISSIKRGGVLVHNRSQSPFGAGWGIAGVYHLDVRNVTFSFTAQGGKQFVNKDITISQGDGTIQAFKCSGCTIIQFEPTAPPGNFSKLNLKFDNSGTLTLKDGTQIVFDANGRHTQTIDTNGNTRTLIYDANGRLVSIVDPLGLVTQFNYTNGLLSSVVDPMSRTTLFAHDGNGNLTQITDPDGSTRQFAYNGFHRMTSQTSKNGFTTTYQYNFAGRSVSATRPDGSTVSVEPLQMVGLVDPGSGSGTSLNPAPLVLIDKIKGSFTDGNGNKTIYQTDKFGQTISITDPLNNVTTITRDADGNPTLTTLPNGATIAQTFDAMGNPLMITQSNIPSNSVKTFTYESMFNRVTSFTDANGNMETFDYDASGNLISSVDARGTKTEFKYEDGNCPGLVTEVIDSSSVLMGLKQEVRLKREYDPQTCNLVKLIDPKGQASLKEQDSAGNLVKAIDPLGRATRFQYDAMNRITKLIEPGNVQTDPPCGALGVTCFEYDNAGNETKITDARGSITQFEYDERDRLSTRTDPLGNKETFVYDGNGNVLFNTKRKGQTIFLEYDGLDRVTRKTVLSKALPAVGFAQSASDGPEANSPARITVNLTAVFSKMVSVDFAVTGGTASGGGVDFILANGTLEFKPGEKSKTIDITLVNDGFSDEGETIELTLSSPVNASLGLNTVHTFTIQ